MTERKIVELPIDSLIPYINNSKTHSEEQIDLIASSIQEFGFTNPILVGTDGRILAGHGRVRAANKLGLKTAPTIDLSDLSEPQQKAYVIADNRLAEVGSEWDFELLSVELESLQESDFDIELTGFDESFILQEIEEGLTDEDAVPDIPDTPVTVEGDIWVMGEHRLMCSDSASTTSLDLLLDGVTPNAIITDPPYGIGIDGQKESKNNKNPKHNRKHHESRGWDSERPDAGIFNWIVSLKVPAVIWGGNYFADLLPATRGWLYWSKGQDGLTMSDGELAWTTEDKPLRSKTVNRGALKGSVHPTQKPTEIIEFSVNFLRVPTSGAVLDLFGGSGTTCIVCEKNEMRSYLMELDPKYCDVIVTRFMEYTGKTAILESTGKTFDEMKSDRGITMEDPVEEMV